MSTNIPVLECGEFRAVSARALVWKANELTNGTAFQAGAGRLLAGILSEETSSTNTVCLDCTGIYTIGDHALTAVANVLEASSKILVLINGTQCSDHFCHALQRHRIAGSHDAELATWVFPGRNAESPKRLDYKRFADEARQKQLEEIVYQSYRALPESQERLQSTPLIAKGVFNARSIASSPNQFMLVTVTMAERIEAWLRSHPHSGSIRLLSVSLRASPFAAGISQLLKIPVEIIDHMGPKMKILEQYSLQNDASPSGYIYIGDFTVGGSELKIAETFAVTKGSSLILSAVIGTILNPKCYSDSGRLLSLVCASECEILKNNIGNYSLL